MWPVLGYALRVRMEHLARMNPSPPSPQATALRWTVCPRSQLNSSAWLSQAQAGRFQVILTHWRDWRSDPRPLGEWASRVRQHRLVAGILIPFSTIAVLPLTELDAIGPLLLVLAPESPEDPEHWHDFLATLARTRLAKLRWSMLGVPVCHLASWLPDVVLAQPPARPHAPACATCGARMQCAGPLAAQPVMPLPEPISNQFDLLDGPQATALLCLDGPSPRFFVSEQPPSATIVEALARGQVYLDRSEKPRLDDFAADLTLLEQVDGRVWRVADQQPFAAEEALLLAQLRELSGVVVDIGAGPIRYVQELARAQASNVLRYVAVEPDLSALERAAAALPEALCLQGTGEHLPLRDGCADAVMMLRSFNHLRDVPQALREVARVLKPGGVFLACDNVAFGLCRTPEQLARAHAIPVSETPFEHYRNADAPDAARALCAAVPDGFHVDTVQAVGPGTSNQWFLRATRR